MTRLSLEDAETDLEEQGFDGVRLVESPTTHHTEWGAVRVVPLEDGGYLLGVKGEEELEHPAGYPPDEGYVTVRPGTFADEAAAEIAGVLAEHFDEVPENLIQQLTVESGEARVNIEVEDMIEVTYFDGDEFTETESGEAE